MSTLTEAIDAAEQRKESAVGDEALVAVPSDFQSRAVFSGFDIDHDELIEISERAGGFFARLAADGNLTLTKTMSMAWTDALLVGIMLGSKSAQHTNTEHDSHT